MLLLRGLEHLPVLLQLALASHLLHVHIHVASLEVDEVWHLAESLVIHIGWHLLILHGHHVIVLCIVVKVGWWIYEILLLVYHLRREAHLLLANIELLLHQDIILLVIILVHAHNVLLQLMVLRHVGLGLGLLLLLVLVSRHAGVEHVHHVVVHVLLVVHLLHHLRLLLHKLVLLLLLCSAHHLRIKGPILTLTTIWSVHLLLLVLRDLTTIQLLLLLHHHLCVH
jgi:hypothetical protein